MKCQNLFSGKNKINIILICPESDKVFGYQLIAILVLIFEQVHFICQKLLDEWQAVEIS